MSPPEKPSEIISQLAERIAALEKRLDSWSGSGSQIPCRVERLVIEKLTTDKVEINLETLDINELSGILNIGQSYESTIVRQAPPPETKRHSPIRQRSAQEQVTPQIRVKYAGNCTNN